MFYNILLYVLQSGYIKIGYNPMPQAAREIKEIERTGFIVLSIIVLSIIVLSIKLLTSQ